MKKFDVVSFRQHFPILQQSIESHRLVYFDNAATTQKPDVVIETERSYYRTINANVHRASHYLSSQATIAFEQARASVQTFINARHNQEIIWTKGSTESINLVAHAWGLNNLTSGDEILLSYAEHHANIVPWQVIAEQTGATIKVLPLTEEGVIDVANIDNYLTNNTKIVCCCHVSNVIGKINPIEQIITKAKKVGALSLIDGAQAIANLAVDVQQLDCDFYVFSAHKLYGPTGVGVLYGKKVILEQMTPYQYGGEMIKKVSFSGTTFNQLPFKFEAGTPNIAGIIAFTQALSFVLAHQVHCQSAYKAQLTQYCFEQLASVIGLSFIVSGKPDLPLFSFTIKGFHQQDIALALDAKGIAVRAGHHCAMPLMEYLQLEGCVRVSLSPYNTREEVDMLIAALNTLTMPVEDEHLSIKVKQTFAREQLSADDIVVKFSDIKGWDGRHREIMLLGKTLDRMDRTLRNDETLISGCESAAWLNVTRSEQGYFYLQGDSDAKIIRGLMVIVFAALNNKTADEILNFDIHEYFEQLGLIKHLSPSRGNGLLAIVEKIHCIVSL